MNYSPHRIYDYETHIYLFCVIVGVAATTSSDDTAVTGADATGFPSGGGADSAARSVLREPVLLLHLSVRPHQRDHLSEIHLTTAQADTPRHEDCNSAHAVDKTILQA